MKYAREFLANALLGGALVVLPLYLALLLLLKGMQAVVGLAVRTRAGRTIRGRMEVSVFGRIPAMKVPNT
jgi:hypothetical protein